MPVVYQRLTDRVLATGITPSDLIHIVIPSDVSQDPDGSSYKATIQQVFDSYDDIFVTGGTYSNGTTTFINTSGGTFTVTGFTQQFTGGSSNCITDFYTSNIHSCSPLNVNPLDEGNVYFGSTSGVTIDLSNNRVGIGTTTPSEKLDVSGKTKTISLQVTSGATTGYVLTSDSLGNGHWLPLSSRGLFSQTGDSTPISATTSELSLIGNGVGSLSVPANGFSIGDSFRLIIGGHISSRNGDTLTINVKTNSTLLGTTGAITMPNITSKHFNFQIDFTIRNIGGAGTASIVSLGRFTYTKNASNAYEGSDFSDIENTTFNTTIVNNLNITAQFNTTNPANQIYSELLTLSKTY